MSYILHPRLQQDSFFLADLLLSELRLFDQADLVWMILVPKRENLCELIDLTEEEQGIVWREIAFISARLKQHFPCDKLNIASLGNVVPQLHIHVIARRFDDPYFPKPPFGLNPVPYPLAEKEQMIQKLRRLVDETSFSL